MVARADDILAVLDKCCDSFTFPMLDNGYVYLAATRLSLFRSEENWAMVIEVFGYSPRTGVPDTSIFTFASRLHQRNPRSTYVNDAAYHNYLAHHPNNEFRSVFPIEPGDWQDPTDDELVAPDATVLQVRGRPVRIPRREQFSQAGVVLHDPERIWIFELCRYLGSIAREDVLATATERHVSVSPEMQQILQLEEWCHPDVVDAEQRPSGSRTFQQLAQVLVTGDVRLYQPDEPANTHWRNWPAGGTL
jgi:hypothetical protein